MANSTINQTKINGVVYDIEDTWARDEIGKLTPSSHSHTNKDVLDAITAAYTTEEKTKLGNIQDGAEVNVQSDWAVTDTSSDAYIKNKPTTIAGYGITDAYTKTQVDSAISTEATAREAADTTLTTNLNAEIERATAAEATNATAISTETSEREAADSALDGRLDKVEGSKIVIQKNGSTVAEFVPNVNETVTANLSIPTTPADIGAIASTEKGAANGVATLDGDGKVPSSQLPSYVDDVLEFASISDFPATGESGKIYVALDTNLTYRWSGTTYVEISKSLALGETSSTAYYGDKGKTAYDHSQIVDGTNPHKTTFANIETKPTSISGYGITDAYTKTEVDTELEKKVDKVEGKGLSTNDYTTAEKEKLAGIAAGAEVNVQSDWAETNRAKDSYIVNKPNLATVATSGDYKDLSNRPSLTVVEKQLVWTDPTVTNS